MWQRGESQTNKNATAQRVFAPKICPRQFESEVRGERGVGCFARPTVARINRNRTVKTLSPLCSEARAAAIEVAETARSFGGVELSRVTSGARPVETSLVLCISRPALSHAQSMRGARTAWKPTLTRRKFLHMWPFVTCHFSVTSLSAVSQSRPVNFLASEMPPPISALPKYS